MFILVNLNYIVGSRILEYTQDMIYLSAATFGRSVIIYFVHASNVFLWVIHNSLYAINRRVLLVVIICLIYTSSSTFHQVEHCTQKWDVQRVPCASLFWSNVRSNEKCCSRNCALLKIIKIKR